MFTFGTTNHKTVRRFRIAQFNGRTATVRSCGLSVTGHVRSVRESKSANPRRWTITIVPNASATETRSLRHAPRVRIFAEDFY